jgi:hypothetical protein
MHIICGSGNTVLPQKDGNKRSHLFLKSQYEMDQNDDNIF